VEYLYDFGDSWSQDVELEDILPAEAGATYPRCMDGARACPPEDCGSIPGYYSLLKAMEHPDDEESRELLGWLGDDLMRYPPFEPEVFDLDRVIFDDPNRRWRGTFLDDEDFQTALPLRDETGRPKAFVQRTPEQREIVEILDTFDLFSGRYEREAADLAITHRDAIIPEFIAILEDALKYPEGIEEDEDYFGHLYAIMLLGHFRAVEAHEIIVAIASLPDELPHRMFDTLITEDLSFILLRTCGGDFTSIKCLAENREADEYCRGAAADAIAFAVMEGSMTRKDALAWLGDRLTDPDAHDHDTFGSIVASNICDLYPEDMMPLIEVAFDKGIIDPMFIDYGFFEETLASGELSCLDRFRREYELRNLDDLHARMSWWYCFQDDVNPAPTSFPPIPGVHGASSAKKKKGKSKRKQTKKSRKKNKKK
jgi:hypothetical protein